jgi:hypothetical protein
MILGFKNFDYIYIYIYIFSFTGDTFGDQKKTTYELNLKTNRDSWRLIIHKKIKNKKKIKKKNKCVIDLPELNTPEFLIMGQVLKLFS